ncbi:hypothetical protein MN116_001873 [Schistosoma mekongi]|uniref:Uncharacterized protein n=1 Tax=Schistosoma mekongi TaxID=38744 RepID=A0AAE1ZK15_SCHME|nr:hypothetical protein MN116_001873 [Schistosoma mekongi]
MNKNLSFKLNKITNNFRSKMINCNKNIETNEVIHNANNSFMHNFTNHYIKVTKRKGKQYQLLLNNIIYLLIIILLCNQSLHCINENICVNAMHLPDTYLSSLTETSTESMTTLQNDQRELPQYWIESPVVKLFKTPKGIQQNDLDNTLQSENKIMQRISLIFQDKKAIQDLLREMNAYYLTYGRPRYG